MKENSFGLLTIANMTECIVVVGNARCVED